MGASFSGYAKALPVADVHPAHLAACLPRLSDASIRRLQACSRLSSSLGALLAAREGLAAWPEVESVVGPARLALASRAQIERAARVMGAIWHAAAVRSCISSGAVRWLVAEIGVEARMAALRHAALDVAGPEPLPPGELAAVILRSADTCLGVWLSTLPGGLRQGVLLKLPPREATTVEVDERAESIIAAAVEVVLPEHESADAVG